MNFRDEHGQAQFEEMWEAYGGEVIPRMRFFTPTELFWEKLEETRSKFGIELLLDCGTGNGDLPKEARERDIRMGGIDIMLREGNSLTEVQLIPAHRLPSNKTMWKMVCRPDHSGWVKPLLKQSLSEGSGFIYIGLRRNMAMDLNECMMELPYITFESVGEENEEMLVFPPIELTEPN